AVRAPLLISSPADLPRFRRLAGDGGLWGLHISYAGQPTPNGLAEAFLIGSDFIGDDPVALVLGDNIFYGQGFSSRLREEVPELDGCTLFAYPDKDTERNGDGVGDEYV